MQSLWREHRLKLLALLMAMFLWLYVAQEQNPMVDVPFNGVALTVHHVPQDVLVQGVPETVNIRVQGNRNVLGMLHKSDFTAHLTLPEKITPGDLKLSVQVPAPPGVKVVKITPGQVLMQVDKIITKSVPVTAQLQGDPADGVILGKASVQPAQVQLQGPSLALAPINEMKVMVDVAGAKTNLVKQMPLTLPHKNITLQPGQVTVTVPLDDMPMREIPVRVHVAGTPAQGFQVGEMLIHPDVVQVQGVPERIGELSSIDTVTLDLSGAAADIERTLKLDLPPGISAVEPRQVQVQVKLVPWEQTDDPDPAEPTDNGDDQAQPPGEG